MNITAETKIIGDAYPGFYSAGLSMLDSATMKRFKVSTENDTNTILTSDDGCVLNVKHIFDPVSGTTEITTTFTNGSDTDKTLEMLTSFELAGIKADRMHRLLSFWSAEGRLKTDKITDLNLEMSWNHMGLRSEKFGNVGSMPIRKYFPWCVLEDSESGTFTGVQLYSPSSWQIEVTCQREELFTLSGGIADRDFGAWTRVIKPGESFTAPKAVVAIAGSLEDVCHALVSAQHPDISAVDDHMGITFNEYCTSWGAPTEESMLKITDKLEGLGIQYLMMDCGWFAGNMEYWWDNTGEWRVDEKKFPHGLKMIADYIRSKGMIPGIWFELEVASRGCTLYNNPDFLVKRDGMPLSIGDRRFLDMENPEVIAYLKEKVIGTLKENGYGYIKVDYNDTLGMGCDGPESEGENIRRKMQGTQNFFRLMKKEIPDLVIENCSSGGHRLEPSMMELSSMASFSDAHEAVCLPIIAANLHRAIRPEQSQIWAVLRPEDDMARIHYSMCATFLGRMGLSGDIYSLTDEQFDEVKAALEFYRKAADIIKYGKTTIIKCTTESYARPTGGQLVIREWKGKKLAVYHRFENSVSFEDFAGDALSGNYSSYGLADCDFSGECRIYE